MAGKGFLIVMAKISPQKEEEFNRWYNEIHLPYALERLPGILSGRRYKIRDVRTILDDGELRGEDIEYQYMAVYEFESYDAMNNGLESGILAEAIAEYNAAFGVGGRHHIRAEEIKALIVG